MRHKNLDLIGVMLIAAINVAWAQLPDRPLGISIILGMPLVFVLPGYALTQGLFYRQSFRSSDRLILKPVLKIAHPIGVADYSILSLGLSLAIDVIIGFLLNLFPFGLQARSWSIALGLVTVVFALLAVFVQRQHPIQATRRLNWRITASQYILFGLAILMTVLAVWYSILRPPQPEPSFTQFWMLPPTRDQHSCAVLIGVQSYETMPVTYRITVKVNGNQVGNWSQVVLAPHQKWEQPVFLNATSVSSMYIEAQLYRVDKPGIIYRVVHLLLHDNGGSRSGAQEQCTT